MASDSLGRSSRRHGWFLIPEETQPPVELQQLQEPVEKSSTSHGVLATEDGEDVGLAKTVLDPRLNAVHVSLLHERQQVPIRTHEYLIELCDRLLSNGPLTLSLQEKEFCSGTRFHDGVAPKVLEQFRRAMASMVAGGFSEVCGIPRDE